MPIRARRLACFHCGLPLPATDREHYGYQCHACVVHEHELLLLEAREPGDPGLEWLETIPVEIGRRVAIRDRDENFEADGRARSRPLENAA